MESHHYAGIGYRSLLCFDRRSVVRFSMKKVAEIFYGIESPLVENPGQVSVRNFPIDSEREQILKYL
jgi:hypothetical protein